MNVKKGPFKISDKKRSSSIIKTQVGNLTERFSLLCKLPIFVFNAGVKIVYLLFLNWNFDIYMVLCHEL